MEREKDYKKLYEDALERAKAYHRNELSGTRREMTEYIFPELAESKGERIRKEIIEYFKLVDKGEEDYAHPMISGWISWLENHTDSETTCKITHKFKPGDIIQFRANPSFRHEIKSVGDEFYIGSDGSTLGMFYTDGAFELVRRPKNTKIVHKYANEDEQRKAFVPGFVLLKNEEYEELKKEADEKALNWNDAEFEDCFKWFYNPIGLKGHTMEEVFKEGMHAVIGQMTRKNLYARELCWVPNDEEKKDLQDIINALESDGFNQMAKRLKNIQKNLGKVKFKKPPYRPSDSQLDDLKAAADEMHGYNRKYPKLDSLYYELREQYERAE